MKINKKHYSLYFCEFKKKIKAQTTAQTLPQTLEVYSDFHSWRETRHLESYFQYSNIQYQMYNITEIAVLQRITYLIIHVDSHTKCTTNKHACAVCTASDRH